MIDFQVLKHLVPVRAVLNSIGWTPTFVWPALRGPCPIHGSAPDSRSFAVSRDGFGFCCHKCKRKGDALELYMALHPGIGHANAAVALCRLAGLPIPQTHGTE